MIPSMNSEGKNVNKELYVFRMDIIFPHDPEDKKCYQILILISQFFLWPNLVIQVLYVISGQSILCYLTC